jgi:hypothetical protein
LACFRTPRRKSRSRLIVRLEIPSDFRLAMYARTDSAVILRSSAAPKNATRGCDDGATTEVTNRRYIFNQAFEWSAQLIFRLTRRGRICELTLYGSTEIRYCRFYV